VAGGGGFNSSIKGLNKVDLDLLSTEILDQWADHDLVN